MYPRREPPRKAERWANLLDEVRGILLDFHLIETQAARIDALVDALKRITLVLGDMVERERLIEIAEDAANKRGNT